MSHMPSFSLVGALEFRSVVASLKRESRASSLNVFDTPVTPYAGGHYHSLSRASLSRSRSRMNSNTFVDEATDPWDRALAGSASSMPLHDRSPPDLRESMILEDDGEHNVVTPNEQSLTASMHSHESSVPSDFQTSATTSKHHGHALFIHSYRLKSILKETYKTLFPSLHEFLSKSVLGQIASVFAAPAILLLTLTLPVVVTPYERAHENETKSHTQAQHDPTRVSQHTLVELGEDDSERVMMAEDEVERELHPDTVKFNKWLTAAQCVFGPIFCVAVLFSEGIPFSSYFIHPYLVSSQMALTDSRIYS